MGTRTVSLHGTKLGKAFESADQLFDMVCGQAAAISERDEHAAMIFVGTPSDTYIFLVVEFMKSDSTKDDLVQCIQDFIKKNDGKYTCMVSEAWTAQATEEEADAGKRAHNDPNRGEALHVVCESPFIMKSRMANILRNKQGKRAGLGAFREHVYGEEIKKDFRFKFFAH